MQRDCTSRSGPCCSKPTPPVYSFICAIHLTRWHAGKETERSSVSTRTLNKIRVSYAYVSFDSQGYSVTYWHSDTMHERNRTYSRPQSHNGGIITNETTIKRLRKWQRTFHVQNVRQNNNTHVPYDSKIKYSPYVRTDRTIPPNVCMSGNFATGHV